MFNCIKRYHDWKTRRGNKKKLTELQKLSELKKWANLQKLANLQGWADLKLWSKLTRNDPFTLVNEARMSNGLKPLIYDSRLAAFAKEHCIWMIDTKRLSHDGANLRFAQSGYKIGGENCAQGYPSARALVNGWLSSPGHKANIMNPQFTHAGIASIFGYACQMFGG